MTPANGACPAITTQEIDFGAILVSIRNDKFCLNDPKYALKIIPSDATPNVTGVGITDDKKFFDPGQTAGQTGPFKLYNDGVEFASVTVERSLLKQKLILQFQLQMKH